MTQKRIKITAYLSECVADEAQQAVADQLNVDSVNLQPTTSEMYAHIDLVDGDYVLSEFVSSLVVELRSFVSDLQVALRAVEVTPFKYYFVLDAPDRESLAPALEELETFFAESAADAGIQVIGVGRGTYDSCTTMPTSVNNQPLTHAKWLN